MKFQPLGNEPVPLNSDPWLAPFREKLRERSRRAVATVKRLTGGKSTLAEFAYEATPFKEGKPFRPLDQLMANQPPGCAYLLPKPFQELMTSPNSPIRDFYPKRVRYESGSITNRSSTTRTDCRFGGCGPR